MKKQDAAPTRFGPEAELVDPFDEMTDEIESEVEGVLRREAASVTISIRMPSQLLERTKKVAADGGVPYQSLIKRLVEIGLARLERREATRQVDD